MENDRAIIERRNVSITPFSLLYEIKVLEESFWVEFVYKNGSLVGYV